jgi:hypothetical protein
VQLVALALAPIFAIEPAWQCLQYDCAAKRWNLPAGQAVHAVEPSASAYSPAVHAVHDDAVEAVPRAAEYLPTAQSMQLDACLPEYVPASQSSQAAVDAAEYWPLAQAVHLAPAIATTVVPAPSVTTEPPSQASQTAAWVPE